ncbi:hypothetical protein, partial [Microseira wollei]|uniref:hypothetical protein n=1 Tax=Microseira wollei TaxID=467598 RepID=UPI001CFE8DF1
SSLAVPRPIIQIHSRFDIKVGARHQSGWLPAINSSLAVPLPIIHIKFGRLPIIGSRDTARLTLSVCPRYL